MVKTNKNLLWFTAVILLFSVFLSACSQNSDGNSAGNVSNANGETDEQTTIKVLGTPGIMTELTEHFIPELEEKGVKLELDFVDWDNYDSKQKLAMIDGGGDYDAVFLPGVYVPLWASSGAAQPLNDFMEKNNYDLDDVYNSVKSFAVIDDNWYIAPFLAEAMVQFYRTDVYESANLKPATTIDELYSNGQALTNENMYGVAYPAGAGEHASSFGSYFLWSYGADYFDEQNIPQLDSPEAIEAVNMFAKILQETAPSGVTTWTNSEPVAAFGSGNLATMIMWPSYYATLANEETSKVFDKIGVAPVPAGPSGKAVARFGSWGIAITKNTQKQEAAELFVKTLTSEEGLKLIASIASSSSKKVNSDPELLEQNPTLGPSASVLDDAKERPPLPEASQINTAVGNAINTVVAGKDAEEQMKRIQQEVYQIMEEAGYYE